MKALAWTSLPNKDILFLTRTPSLQKRLKRFNERREEVEREAEKEKKRNVWDNHRRKTERGKDIKAHSLIGTAQWLSYTWNPSETAVCNSKLELELYPVLLALFSICWLLYQLPHSPGNHLLLLVGGVATAADWMDGCGQEVQPVVFKVLIHQWQDDLRVKWHRNFNYHLLSYPHWILLILLNTKKQLELMAPVLVTPVRRFRTLLQTSLIITVG